ncbi:COMPASS (complex proteins associated with Set1p) component [Emydomyces testavorans]|uniref:COMPASS (Complex proteins associated with Set1p) component n=1 Tax=Emydomyces testavorans TaxID=2070801 RepID=A0AAF0DB52_9EURO|nr:COMPASS (complex proteins associated with Set1p) component [Emydomyces testavorans]
MGSKAEQVISSTDNIADTIDLPLESRSGHDIAHARISEEIHSTMSRPVVEIRVASAATYADKLHNGDQVRSRHLFNGAYLSQDDDFTPDTSHIRSTDPVSLEYWKEVLSKCRPENQLNTPAPGRRDTFALGSVIIKSDHRSPEPTGDYSFVDKNEEVAVTLAAEALPGFKLPEYYLRTKVQGRDVLIRSRIPGISLEVAWPHLTPEQKASFKTQTRDIVRGIHCIKPSESKTSYVADASGPQGNINIRQDERDILFGNGSVQDNELGLSHNNLVPSNIIVDSDKIVGIVGWSNAGYFSFNKSGQVHRGIRCKDHNGDKISELWEESMPWHDLYDIGDNEKIAFSGPIHTEAAPSKLSVKTEESIPSLNTVPPIATSEAFDFPTPKKIATLKQETVSRASSSERSSPAPSVKTTKKRAIAPSVVKKGQAVRKPAAKKRKLNDEESIDGTVKSQRSSATPSSARAKSSTQRNWKQHSASLAGSPVPDGKGQGKSYDPGEDMDDDEVDSSELFCICRKPDNHTWMIACDGGCDDWFHGKCVNMDQADADLIDKYICPNCEEKYGSRTTWKRMCRLPGCRRPARVTAKTPSKYCSDDHGVEFMKRKIQSDPRRSASAGDTIATGSNTTKRGSSAITKGRQRDSENGSIEQERSNPNEDEDEDENDLDGDDVATEREETEDLIIRGGVLTPREVKAIADGVNSAEEFRKLGESLLSTETQALNSLHKAAELFSARNQVSNGEIDFDLIAENIEWTSEERRQMDLLKEQRKALLNRSHILRDRDKFLVLVRQRAKSILERLRQNDPKGWKDICGFDARLSWSDEEFDEWRQTEPGQKALQDGVLERDPPEDGAGDTEMADAEKAGDEVESIAQGVCIKKRCEQHRQWAKVQQQDILFEQSVVRDQLARCEKSATGVIEGVVLRVYGDQDKDMG